MSNTLEEDAITKRRKELIAPKDRYRVVVVDTFGIPGEEDITINDFDTLEEALEVAKERGDPEKSLVCYVYDDKGRELSKKEEKKGELARLYEAEIKKLRSQGMNDVEASKKASGLFRSLLKKKQEYLAAKKKSKELEKKV